MDMPSAIRAVVERRDLSAAEMTQVMRIIMTGEATPAQIGGFLVGLRMKGETVEEITAAAQVMRELASRVRVEGAHVVDIVGTGGDASGTFNISTCAALVAAAAGATVAKHGNRAVSGKSGAADLLEAAGVKLDIPLERLEACIARLGIGFLFAPLHHGAMRHAIGPRREMAIRTIFNVLGPLTNPAEARNQVVGVFSAELVEPIAQVLKNLGSHHALVVHADDGLDEISISAPTQVAELKDGQIRSYTIRPEEYDVDRAPLAAIRVAGSQESLQLIRRVLANEPGPARDIVALNAGAAIYAAGLAPDLRAGIDKALAALADGSAAYKLERLVAFTNGRE
ncbi:MAG TPA: anthranilate phosphoribosyltransferase [Candidatus Competibacteraceae bacterium]|nr:anthranilate phosphoribosyltransferase [Candidatus Competibacteraceae bacterium]